MLSLTKYEKYILIFLLFTGLLGTGLLRHRKALTRRAPEAKIYKDHLKKPAVINVNTATEEELTSLKGIGPTLALRISEYRRANGPFTEKKELEKVKGIGPSKLEAIKGMIRLK